MAEQNLRRNGHLDPFLKSISFELDPDLRVEHPVLKLAHEAWSAAREAREMPARRDLDPIRLARELLPHLLLIDVEPAPPRYRWRLVGTHVTERLGRDSTGRYWDELYEPAVLRALRRGPDWVLRHRCPVRTVGIAPMVGKGHVRSENLDLPLSSDGERINMIMVASIYG